MTRELVFRDFGPNKWAGFFVKKEFINGNGKYRVYFEERHVGDYDTLSEAECAFLCYRFGKKPKSTYE